MNDEKIMENLLLTTKGVCDLYLHGTIESSNQNVHAAFDDALQGFGLHSCTFEHMGARYALIYAISPSEKARAWACRHTWLSIEEDIPSLSDAAQVFRRMNACLHGGFYLPRGCATRLPPDAPAPSPPDAARLTEAILQRQEERASALLTSYLDTYASLMKGPDMLIIRTADLLCHVSTLLHAHDEGVTPLRVTELCAGFQECGDFPAFRAVHPDALSRAALPDRSGPAVLHEPLLFQHAFLQALRRKAARFYPHGSAAKGLRAAAQHRPDRSRKPAGVIQQPAVHRSQAIH